MTRGTRLLIMVFVLIGVIFLMMDCAKRSLRRQHPQQVPEGGGGQSLLIHESPPGRA
jgi:hypothetical protein